MAGASGGTEQVHFQIGHAAGPDWHATTLAALAGAGAPEPGANLGFVYAADVFADSFDSIVAVLRDATGILHWVGTVGIGVLAGRQEYFGEPAVAVMIAAMPPEAFRVLPIQAPGAIKLPPGFARWIGEANPTLGLVHADPRCAALPDMLAELSETTGAFLTGGIASSESAAPPQVADAAGEGGLSGILFGTAGGGVAVATGLSQGCTPIGGTHTVTESIKNIVVALDGRPALDVLLEDAGIVMGPHLAQALAPVHVALPIPGSDTADYLVRNLIGIDPRAGAVGIAALADPGDRLLFVRRDAAAAEKDLRRMLRELKERLAAPIAGGIYVSCLARGQNLFGARCREVGIVAEELGEFPLIGFFANGEVSNARLYGYTGVLTLFTRN